VVSIAPFSTPAFTPTPNAPIQKTALFACFGFSLFIHFSRGGSADPICPYVRTPMAVAVGDERYLSTRLENSTEFAIRCAYVIYTCGTIAHRDEAAPLISPVIRNEMTPRRPPPSPPPSSAQFQLSSRLVPALSALPSRRVPTHAGARVVATIGEPVGGA